MLILTRKSRQRIFIGKEIILEIRSVKNGTVSIGIQAPPDVKIIREELASRPENCLPEAECPAHAESLLDPRN